VFLTSWAGELSVYQQALLEGEHTFTLYPGGEGYYFLVVETPLHREAQKLISHGGAGVWRIEHSGSNTGFHGFRSDRSGFSWVPGDQLLLTGYVHLTGNILAGKLIIDDPAYSSLYTFNFEAEPYPPGTVHCTPSNPTAVIDVYNPVTGKVWMDRNLGASQAATGYTDSSAYGDLYQWGRFADGHQCRNSAVTSTISTTSQPGHSSFISSSGGYTTPPFQDWITPQNMNLWMWPSGENNPCPNGYRLPTEAELYAERMSWNSLGGPIGSPLRLPLAGVREYSNGAHNSSGHGGHYWSSTLFNAFSQGILLSESGFSTLGPYSRAFGRTVRCIRH
jgi:hypothetical protein